MDAKRIVIIGATSGIGREVAELYIKQGWHVGVAGRRSDMLEEVRRICPERVVCERIDVTSSDSPKHLADLIEKLGGMDVYLHCSGIGHQNRMLNLDIESDTISTNCAGFVRLIDSAFAYFRSAGHGHIAAISSIAGTRGLGVAPAYSASKKFQNTYLQCLSQLARMEHLDICFTDIRPGFVKTHLLDGDQNYPFQLDAGKVAEDIVKAISRRKRVVVIDWVYAIVTFFWSLIPGFIWERMNIHTNKKSK